MTFLAPYFIWLLPLGAIPIIIHLLNKAPVKKVQFSTLMFLSPATKKIVKRFKLLELLLLLLRVCIILFLTLAFARPLWRGYGAREEGLRNIILIDNSYSTGYRHGTGVSLQLSKDLAVEIVKEMGGQFALGIINERLSEFEPFTNDTARIIEKIRDIELSAYSTDLMTSLNDVISILEKEEVDDSPKNIIIFSDFNKNILKKDTIIEAEDVNFLLIDTADGNKNSWVEEVTSKPAYVGIPTTIDVRLNSNHTTPSRVSLFIEGEKRHSKQYDISGKTSLRFKHIFPPKTGIYTGWIELNAASNDDRIDIDNRHYFQTTVNDRIKVLLVEGSPSYTFINSESYFITKALSPGNFRTPMSYRVVNSDELKLMDITDYDILLLLNVEIDDVLFKKVTEFSSSGGGLGIFMGDNINYNDYNRMLTSIMPVELIDPVPLENFKSSKLTVSDKFKDVFKYSKDINFLKLYRTMGKSKETPAIKINNIPILWLYSPDTLVRGRVALWTSSINMAWTDFPMESAYPAFIQEIVKYLAVQQDAERQMDNLKVGSLIGGVVKEKSGIYESDGKKYTVNLDIQSGESKLEKLSESELKKLFPQVQELFYIPYSDQLRAEIIKRILGEEKSGIFLLAAFIALIGEEFLRKYLDPRKKS